MKRILLLAFILIPNFANAYYWVDAVPTYVALIDGGLLVRGEFDTSKSSCATGSGIFLKSNTNDEKAFDRKLSLAMMAFASGKNLKVLINDPLDTNCAVVAAHGELPIIYEGYWIIH